MNIKQESETDFIDGALIWILSPRQLLVDTGFSR